jgi:hypothetical protein
MVVLFAGRCATHLPKALSKLKQISSSSSDAFSLEELLDAISVSSPWAMEASFRDHIHECGMRIRLQQELIFVSEGEFVAPMYY